MSNETPATRVPVAAAISIAALLWVATPNAHSQCVIGTNSALTFDGIDDILNVPNQPALSGMPQLTIEVWFTCLPNGSATQSLVSKSKNLGGTGGARSYALQVTNAGQIGFFVVNSGNSTQSFFSAHPSALSDGSWHHVAATLGSGTWAIYIDGVQSSTGAYGQPINASNLPLRIGSALASDGVTPNNFINGSIDEVRIWNVARTPSDIAASMNSGLIGTELGLIGYWRFDEGSGHTVFNSAAATGATLDGTLGANALPGTDDPTWTSTGLPPLSYCPPCPTPPCGQINSPCATLTVNGVGAAAQGPFNVAVPPAGVLSLNWSGPPNQPYVLVATTNLIPGQPLLPPSLVVDVNIGNYFLVYSGFDPVFGPLYFTNAAGTSGQTWTHPGVPLGVTINVQGLIYDLANTCSGGVGLATTASFSIQL